MKEMRTIVLGLLRRGQLYGYQIRRTLQQEQFRAWAVDPAARLYDELAQMAAEGLIERSGAEQREGRPSHSLYRITQWGGEELLRSLRQAWASVERKRLSEDIATLFIDALPKEEVVQTLSERLSHLEGELRRLEEARQGRLAQAGEQPAARAVSDHARLRIQSEIKWTRSLRARLEAGEYRRTEVAQPRRPPIPRRKPGRTTEGLGAFTFVLHTHLPYCRKAGRWPHGEEWLHEALSETYVPLANALYDLREEGLDYNMTLSLTPILIEQLADADVKEHFLLYLDQEIAAAKRDIPRFGAQDSMHLEYLATYYRDFYTKIRQTYLERFGGNLVGAFRQLQDEGYLEIITCAATHGYLPLLSRDSSIYGQLRAGVESYRRHFGRAPRAIWLPECAYRPAYVDDDGTVRPAIEEFVSPLGITCFFVETYAIKGGRPVGKAGGDVAIGPYTVIKRPYVVLPLDEAGVSGTTFAAYLVTGSDKGLTDPPVAVIGRNNRTGQQVWSGDLGYPGEADYREFHKKDHRSGLQYWRVTGPRVDLGDKDLYHPDWAQHKVGDHALHFAGLVEQLIREYHTQSNEYGIISANYDTELFGHWWFEGIDWLREVLRQLCSSKVVDLTTPSDYIARHPPEQVITVPESSWGEGGTHWTWDNPDTGWIWESIHDVERRMEQLVERYPQAQGDALAVLNQAAREVLLLQSSDWPFLVTTGQAKQYASERFRAHLERFSRLAHALEAGIGPEGRAYADELYELDKVFPEIDYRWFEERQGRAT